jgi:hypothetical protein
MKNMIQIEHKNFEVFTFWKHSTKVGTIFEVLTPVLNHNDLKITLAFHKFKFTSITLP